MESHLLRQWRKAQNPKLTLEALAKKAKVEPSHLSMIETGKRVPSLALAAELSALTGIPIERFLPQSEAAQ